MSLFKRILFILLIFVISVAIFFSIGTEVTKNLDTYIYDLPYAEGDSHKVVQGYGGRFSHTNEAALDFRMPVGTPIYAAREGIIYSYKDDSNEGGPFSKYNHKANYIIIKHNDGSFGCYWHLQQNGVLVNIGDTVTQGQVIALSGKTGYSAMPHLHFLAWTNRNGQWQQVATRFQTNKGPKYLRPFRRYRNKE